MGKLVNRPRPAKKSNVKPAASVAADDVFVIHADATPSPQTVQRNVAMKRFVASARRRAAVLSAAEKRRADANWKKLAESMNRGRLRKVVVD